MNSEPLESMALAIGRLIDALDDDAVARSAAAQRELTRSLPDLTEAVADGLIPEQRAVLTEMLQFSANHAWPTHHDLPFVLAVLAASPAFGDEATLASVDRLATDCSQPEVRRAAQNVLPALMERVELLKTKRRLLRASDSAAEDERKMVRSASPPGETLPRPAETPEP